VTQILKDILTNAIEELVTDPQFDEAIVAGIFCEPESTDYRLRFFVRVNHPFTLIATANALLLSSLEKIRARAKDTEDQEQKDFWLARADTISKALTVLNFDENTAFSGHKDIHAKPSSLN